MADGNQFPLAQAAAESGRDRRGPMRPGQLASARARISGRLLARGFMAADAAFLLLAALAFDATQGWSRTEGFLGAVLAWTLLFGCGAYSLRRQEAKGRHLAMAAIAAAAGWFTAMAIGSV